MSTRRIGVKIRSLCRGAHVVGTLHQTRAIQLSQGVAGNRLLTEAMLPPTTTTAARKTRAIPVATLEGLAMAPRRVAKQGLLEWKRYDTEVQLLRQFLASSLTRYVFLT